MGLVVKGKLPGAVREVRYLRNRIENKSSIRQFNRWNFWPEVFPHFMLEDNEVLKIKFL